LDALEFAKVTFLAGQVGLPALRGGFAEAGASPPRESHPPAASLEQPTAEAERHPELGADAPSRLPDPAASYQEPGYRRGRLVVAGLVLVLMLVVVAVIIAFLLR
jgi:hypothetical protein